MNLQQAKALAIEEGNVKTIHDKNNQLLWGAVGYDVKYKGDTTQASYSGKNLYDYTDTTSVGSGITVGSDGWVTVSYDNTSGSGAHYESYFTDVIAQLSTSTNYAVVTEIKDVAINNTSIKLYPVSGSSSAQFGSTITVLPSNYPNGGTDVHVISTASSFTSSTSSLRTAISFPAGSKGTFSFRISLLADTSVTSETFSYEPYVGGIPAPNPDYPQTVNVVTGTQTITLTDGVVSDDLTLGLSTTELCKIGTYDDYIYKSGDDWYIHKETGSVTYVGGASENWDLYSSGTSVFRIRILDMKGQDNQQQIAPLLCNYYTPIDYAKIINPSYWPDYGIGGRVSASSGIAIRNKDCANVTAFKTWLSAHNTTVYYVLATPTNTQITDSTLITQLEAIHQFLTRYGYNATVSGNLPIIIDRTNL